MAYPLPLSWHKCLALRQTYPSVWLRQWMMGTPTLRQRPSALWPIQFPPTLAWIHPFSGDGNRRVLQRVPEILGLHTPGLQARAEAFGSLGPQMTPNPGTQQRERPEGKRRESYIPLSPESLQPKVCKLLSEMLLECLSLNPHTAMWTRTRAALDPSGICNNSWQGAYWPSVWI